ncbi:hypothetical protein QYR02_01245 [Microbacterium maritypicum]|nr:hypothetical protein [Microbacterium liquefaciens]WKT89565.1 hypothetical protein QYR02_01245 [Microbacterium liquefaciens]
MTFTDEQIAELQARNTRPDLFALVDDLFEAQMTTEEPLTQGWMRSAA